MQTNILMKLPAIKVWRIYTLVLWICLSGISLIPWQAYAAEPVKIGVLAFRPKPQTLAQWQPLADALKQAIPEHDFVVQAYTFPELEKATANKQLDFVLTNPAHYILLTKRHGLSAPLATLAVNDHGQRLVTFGGVIFTRAEQNNINLLTDIKNKTIAATDVDSFGGYQMQAYELNKAGINAQQDNKLVITGMPHDNVVSAVLNTRADVGFVRTGVLEDMVREGKLDIKKLKIINRQKAENFPVVTSTHLYPEWAFAYLPHVDENLARHVAAALFGLEENVIATRAMNIHGFVVPADYTPVSDLLKELRVKPFDITPSFTVQDIWVQYRYPLIGALVALGFIALLSVRLVLTKYRLAEAYENTNALLQSMAEGAYGVDMNGNCTFVNKAFLKILGYDHASELIGRHIHEVIHHSHEDGCRYPADECKMYASYRWNESIHTDDEVFWRKDGKAVPVEYWSQPVVSNGVAMGAIATFVDITERKASEAKLRMLSTAIEQGPTSVAIANLDAEIEYINPRFTQVTGYSREEAVGKNPRILQSGLTDKAIYATMWDRLKQGQPWFGEFVNKRKNGEIYYEEAHISPVKDDHGTISHYVAVKLDITARKKLEEEVRQLAFYDTLTNLPNRRLLNDRLSQIMAASKRSNAYGALMFLDLDNFKPLNDIHGHVMGDRLLIETAQRLTSCMRDMDTVARFGGDEFVVMLAVLDEDRAVSIAQATIVAEKIRAVLSEPYVLAITHDAQADTTVEHRCTASIGVVMFIDHESSHDDILKWADVAMYEAKDAGRNQIRFYDHLLEAPKLL